jgi:uncharacterized protein (DUF433 family)
VSLVVSIDPNVQGGTPCFPGTRVPVKSLFDYIARDRTLDHFLEQFPSVSRQQVLAVLDQSEALVTSLPQACVT